ncbi:hypothetical protein C5F47_03390 [Nitrosopumilus cobalaminigenes]|uniref:Uncharacterized protein n=1 Tax=Nitrosopumilus cobalaminigenes TaxID=1470066 RepID=A0A7D5M1W3_9ARCH|nr:hypothetical protein [Nitrosopumilus cobalaminigenes]QLH02670.1 hypothetical protein C5F47_03390 [Nitrosopumilus cobalaminigenes]
MATTHIEPTSVRRSVGKGTDVLIGPTPDPLSWNGESFKTEELERLELAGDLMVLSVKGTKSFKMSDAPKARKPKEYHGYIVINKGTKAVKI